MVAAFEKRSDMIKVTARFDRVRGGLPMGWRASIFPEDHQALQRKRADILVTHEAPCSHPHGFVGIDQLAKDMRVGLVVHGHHHHSYESKTPNGIRARGLGLAEPWILRGNSSDI
jgi:predicted phosphodiesterase